MTDTGGWRGRRGGQTSEAGAGGVVLPEAKEFAHECGFFVLELKGESVELLAAPAGFTAREW
ncbi:MAG: hypothetical protein LBS82_06105 [Spirochaetaceae bacterium]|nr:hypothetical protein [Spirochaetaceae bacterium]